MRRMRRLLNKAVTPICGAVRPHPAGGLLCTRNPGHTRSHMAIREGKVVIWDNLDLPASVQPVNGQWVGR